VGTTASLRDLPTSFDIVMVPGSPAIGSEREHHELVDWLRNAGRSARKIASVSNGAFLVARAGLANDRWLTTRERDAQRLASDYPLVHVVTERICLKDGNLYSSGGVSAGVYLALALVGEDLGEHIAGDVAKALLPPGV
jgi:transcriptional regulator GlxA family with amidase domain